MDKVEGKVCQLVTTSTGEKSSISLLLATKPAIIGNIMDANKQESPEDLVRVRQFIDTHEWHFAKTMPQIPHWYCLLKDKNDVEEFRWFAAHIREYSKPGQFYGRTYYYYYLDDYKYWWMDSSVEACDLINRDKVK